MTGPTRLYALADEVGVPPETVMRWLRGHRLFPKSTSSWIDASTAQLVRDEFRAGNGTAGLSVAALARELELSEPFTMALVRDCNLLLVASSEYVTPAAVEELTRKYRRDGIRSEANAETFSKAPPALDTLARVLGISKTQLQAYYFRAAGQDASLTRGAIFALVEDFLHQPRNTGRPTAGVSTSELGRALLLTDAQLTDLLVAAGVADLSQSVVPTHQVPSVLAMWLRLVRRSGPRRADASAPAPSRGQPSGPPTATGPSHSKAPSPRQAGPMVVPVEDGPSARELPLWPDDPIQLGDYELLARLGQGGMGTVYRARRLGTASEVALKSLAHNLREMPEAIERFQREAAVLKQVGGAFTAKVIDFDQSGELPFLVMELLNGHSLEHHVDTTGPLPQLVGRALAISLVESLTALHVLAVIHRDLKPANVMLTSAGVKVIDFGVAHLVERPRITDVGIQPGTLPYMAPEQFQGRAAAQAADIFAWAGTVLFSLTGDDPFPGASPEAIMRAVLDDEPLGLETINDAGLRDCLHRAFAKQPEDRPTAAEIMSGLLEGAAIEDVRGALRVAIASLI